MREVTKDEFKAAIRAMDGYIHTGESHGGTGLPSRSLSKWTDFNGRMLASSHVVTQSDGTVTEELYYLNDGTVDGWALAEGPTSSGSQS